MRGSRLYLSELEDRALIVEADAAAAIVPGDADDNPVLAAAIAGNADVLCTRDRHFDHPDVRSLCEAHSIRVLSDLELLEELRAAAQ